jgi:hypothetical protein
MIVRMPGQKFLDRGFSGPAAAAEDKQCKTSNDFGVRRRRQGQTYAKD